MMAGDRAVGVLVVLMDRVHEMTPDEREVLHLLADHAAIAIDRSRLFGDLQRAYDNLRQTQAQLIQAEKLRALGEMAGGVAHDFNNLLAAILGRAQFVLGKLPTLDPVDVRRCVKIIETAAIDGARTVRRLQEFTRATPRQRHAVEVVGVGDLLEDVLDMARRQWKRETETPDGPVRFELDAVPVPPVAGHATELRDALLNLVANGVEAMPRGGVLTVRARSANGEVTIDIVDGGIGIPPETQARVFEPFFTTKGPQRSGLGLSVAFGIVSRHGGRIEIRSLPDEGTTVRVTLLADSLTARRPEPPVAPPAPSTLRILLIEHDDQIRKTLGDVLRAAGHDVVEADDGPAGLGLVDTIQFDLVCADASLPDMGGAEVLERIVQQRPTLTGLLISAAATPMEVRGAAEGEPSQKNPERTRREERNPLIGPGASSPQPFHVNDVLKVLATVCAAPDSGGQRQ
jgi:signal transduction histidine kinase/CheY-like chemotaxis protein